MKNGQYNKSNDKSITIWRVIVSRLRQVINFAAYCRREQRAIKIIIPTRCISRVFREGFDKRHAFKGKFRRKCPSRRIQRSCLQKEVDGKIIHLASRRWIYTFRTLRTIRVDGKRMEEGIRITLERNIVDAKQFLMQTSHREKNVLFEGHSRRAGRSIVSGRTNIWWWVYIYASARALIFVLAKILHAYLRSKLCSLRYSNSSQLLAAQFSDFSTDISISLANLLRNFTLDKIAIYFISNKLKHSAHYFQVSGSLKLKK